jgi:hypothetical protein
MEKTICAIAPHTLFISSSLQPLFGCSQEGKVLRCMSGTAQTLLRQPQVPHNEFSGFYSLGQPGWRTLLLTPENDSFSDPSRNLRRK